HGVTLADADPDVAGGVGLGRCPGGEQTFDGLAHGAFGTRDAVGFHELRQHSLRFGDPRRSLGRDRPRTERDDEDSGDERRRPHRVSIHDTSFRISESAAARLTVSTGVPVYFPCRLTAVTSANGAAAVRCNAASPTSS